MVLQMKQSGTRIVYKHIYKQKELAARAASSLYGEGYKTAAYLHFIDNEINATNGNDPCLTAIIQSMIALYVL